MSDKTERSRRALLTGGAVLLGGAVLANEGTADAADGKSLLMGRTNNTASHTTKLTMSGNAQALNVTNSNSGTKAHAIVGDTKNGYGVVGESTKNDGGSRVRSGSRACRRRVPWTARSASVSAPTISIRAASRCGPFRRSTGTR